MKLTFLLAPLLLACLNSCAPSPSLSADIGDGLRATLRQANLGDVTVTQDRTKGVVTLGGHVATEEDKATAATMAQSMAGSQVVANQIEVIPVNGAADAKSINSDLDAGIESNLSAALTQNKLSDHVKFNVVNRVVTLTGEVNSQAMRAQASTVAEAVANVSQVVNELQVKRQKATTTK